MVASTEWPDEKNVAAIKGTSPKLNTSPATTSVESRSVDCILSVSM